MPFTPEYLDVSGEVRHVEVFRKFEAEDSTNTNSYVGIS